MFCKSACEKVIIFVWGTRIIQCERLTYPPEIITQQNETSEGHLIDFQVTHMNPIKVFIEKLNQTHLFLTVSMQMVESLLFICCEHF